MKKILSTLKDLRFVIGVLAGFLALDLLLTAWAPVENSLLFTKNDYEKSVISLGGTEFDKVFYSTSVGVTGYRPDCSQSGYVNFSMVYATIEDLRDILEQKLLTPRSDLVVMLGSSMLMDTMDTDASYPWHHKFYQPYLYFQRDRLTPFASEALSLLSEGSFSLDALPLHDDMQKYLSFGCMTDAELDEKIAKYQELYWWQGLESYEKNFDALREVIGWCDENGVRFRVILSPVNSYYANPENPQAALDEAVRICADAGIEVLDMTNSMPRDCFYDLGHLNNEHGAIIFTEAIDPWLMSTNG